MQRERLVSVVGVLVPLLVLCLAVSGCGWFWRIGPNIQSDTVNHDTPVSTATVANQVKAERVLFTNEAQNGVLVVTMIRESDVYDLHTDIVDRQVYQENGYGATHERWPVWVDTAIGSVLAVGGGAALGLAGSQSSQDQYEYRNDPQTGQRERKPKPNTSMRYKYELAGGIGVGVSIPFLISAIHNGVATQSHNVGTSQFVSLPTEINPRTARSGLANTKVTVTLPSSTSFEASTDIAGKLVLHLPDTPDDFFPLRYIAVITVPSKEARYEIPVNSQTLATLPQTVKAKVDKIFDRVLKAKNIYDDALNTYQAKVGPFEAALNAEKAKQRRYQISGEIRDWKNHVVSVWGTATPEDGRPGEGMSYENTNIIIVSIDHNDQDNAHFNFYHGVHYYLGRETGVGIWGQSVPVRVYGDDLMRSVMLAPVTLPYMKAKEKYEPALKKAKAPYDQVLVEYKEKFPTDPLAIHP